MSAFRDMVNEQLKNANLERENNNIVAQNINNITQQIQTLTSNLINTDNQNNTPVNTENTQK